MYTTLFQDDTTVFWAALVVLSLQFWAQLNRDRKLCSCNCEEKYFKFKENLRCKHRQTCSFFLPITYPSLRCSLTLSVCFMVDAFIPDSSLYHEYAMWSSLYLLWGNCALSALLPPQGGQRSEVKLQPLLGAGTDSVPCLTALTAEL